MNEVTEPPQTSTLQDQQTSASSKTRASDNLPPLADFTQEIRFAVVMYGGVSLAIYINGVAQELLKLVRATAPEIDKGQPTRMARHAPSALKGSELVYRELGQILARGERPMPLDTVKNDSPLRTRFVVDVLSGTSAGGLNAIYLAKALANDQKIDGLKSLWLDEGDIGRLINDNESLQATNLAANGPPRSLLNSRRMYLKLLNALEEMDAKPDGQRSQPSPNEEMDAKPDRQRSQPSPNVDELDLYVTATDIEGQIVELKLADGVTTERRHRHVFRFRYRNECYENHKQEGDRQPSASGGRYPVHNDFQRHNNPFLAFVARCTSAFPVAFEPMSLRDIDEVLQIHNAYAGSPLRSDHNSWKTFYQQYLRPGDGGTSEKAFSQRWFTDGGVLDNYPFSYAADALPTRYATLPVDRKLLYIEPSPENPRPSNGDAPNPTFVDMARLSLSTLPSYETIREDLERLEERNRLIQRVNRIIKGVEDDMRILYGRSARPQREFEVLGQKEQIERKGIAWSSYMRLRVAEVTDDLALMITRANHWDEHSAKFQVVRKIVRYWREQRYVADASDGKQNTFNEFLVDFDLAWRLRRLKFLFARIDELSSLGPPPDDDSAQNRELAERWENMKQCAQATQSKPVAEHEAPPLPVDLRVEKDLTPFRKRLRAIKGEINKAYTLLLQGRAFLWDGGLNKPLFDALIELGVMEKRETEEKQKLEFSRLLKRLKSKRLEEQLATAMEIEEPLSALITMLNISDESMASLLNAGDEAKQNALIADLFKEPHLKLFDTFGTRITALMSMVMFRARQLCDRYLYEEDYQELTPMELLAQRTIRYYFEAFEDYDMILYPIFHATDVGDELDPVEIYRISPRDATRRYDEEKEGIPKLAGTQIRNFGAFFKPNFRVSDLRWGQLDGAERIITALLPNDEDELLRETLIDRAHCAILAEEYFATELKYTDEHQIRKLVEEMQADLDGSLSKEQLAEKFCNVLAVSPLNETTWALQAYLKGTGPLDAFKGRYRTDRDLESLTLVQSAARASKVFGRMLEGYAQANRINSARVAWVTRLAQVFWGLVEMALPDSVPNLLFHHWLKLLYFVEALMVVLGTLLVSQAVQQTGFLAFVATAAIHLAVLFLGDVLSEQPGNQASSADGHAPSSPTPAVSGNGAGPHSGIHQDATKPSSQEKPQRLHIWLKYPAVRFGVVIITAIAVIALLLGVLLLLTITGLSSFWPQIEKVAAPGAEASLFRAIARLLLIVLVAGTFIATVGPDIRTFLSRHSGWLTAIAKIGADIRTALQRDSRSFTAAKLFLRIAAPLAGLMIFGGTLRAAFTPNQLLPAGFNMRAIALELIQTAPQFRQVVESYTAAAIDPFFELRLDTWVMIPGYVLLFGAVGYILHRSDSRLGRYLGPLLGLLALVAGLFDVLENARIGAAILAYYQGVAEATLQVAVNQIWAPTLGKWFLLAAMMGLLALIFLPRSGLAQLVGVLCLAAASVGILGLALEPLMIEYFLGLVGLALIPLGEALWPLRERKAATA